MRIPRPTRLQSLTVPFSQIDIVVHGEDLSVDENGKDVYAWLKEAGKFRTIKRTDGISTSDLINRILSQYNDYVKRNLARGYSGKQMNIGFVKVRA